MTPFLNASQVATRYGVAKKTVYWWVSLGKIPNIRLGGCLRFKLNDLEAWESSLNQKQEWSVKDKGKPSRVEKGV